MHTIVEDDQLTQRPFRFTRIVCGIELILVLLRIAFSSEFVCLFQTSSAVTQEIQNISVTYL